MTPLPAPGVPRTAERRIFHERHHAQYDANGNRASLSEGGTTFDYFYDAQNRLARADGFGGSIHLQYDAAGRRTVLSRPNGVRTSYTYDDANQILGIVHAKGPSVVLGFGYQYDAHGMRLSKTRETGYREAYGYDLGDRLVRVDYGTAKRVEYSLDVLGNRVLEDTTTSPSTGLARNTGTFNAFNQHVTTGGPGSFFPLTSFAYDLNGNLLSETKSPKSPSGQPAEVTTYAWDRDDRLRTVTTPSGFATSYEYDANGLRSRRVDATGSRGYILDGATPLLERDSVGGSLVRYLSNPGAFDEVIAYQSGNSTEFPLTDALGSVYASVDSSALLTHRYDYDVFGNRIDLGSSGQALEIGFTGRIHDANGLMDHRHRLRNPSLGSWLSNDRVAFLDGPNGYLYSRSAPTRFADPTGLFINDLAAMFGRNAMLAEAALAYAEGGEVDPEAIAAAWTVLTLDDVANLSAGFGDVFLFGLGPSLRRFFGGDCVNYNSTAYHAGTVIGVVASIVLFGAATLETRAAAANLDQGASWLTRSVFRWGKGPFKFEGKMVNQWHFHVGPGESLMRHHLPQELHTWTRHFMGLARRLLNKF